MVFNIPTFKVYNKIIYKKICNPMSNGLVKKKQNTSTTNVKLGVLQRKKKNKVKFDFSPKPRLK